MFIKGRMAPLDGREVLFIGKSAYLPDGFFVNYLTLVETKLSERLLRAHTRKKQYFIPVYWGDGAYAPLVIYLC